MQKTYRDRNFKDAYELYVNGELADVRSASGPIGDEGPDRNQLRIGGRRTRQRGHRHGGDSG